MDFRLLGNRAFLVGDHEQRSNSEGPRVDSHDLRQPCVSVVFL